MSIDGVLKEDLNVKDLNSVEKSLPSLEFPVEKDEIFNSLQRMLSNYDLMYNRKTKSNGLGVNRLFAASILFPEDFNKFYLNQDFILFLNNKYKWPDSGVFSEMEYESAHIAEVGMLNNMWLIKDNRRLIPPVENSKSVLLNTAYSGFYEENLLVDYGIKNFSPELFDSKFENEWIESGYSSIAFKHTMNEFKYPYKENYEVVRKLALGRLASPLAFEKFKANEGFKNFDWNLVKDEVSEFKDKNDDRWIDLSFFSQIVLADEIKTEGNKLEIIKNPIKLESKELPLPDRRNF